MRLIMRTLVAAAMVAAPLPLTAQKPTPTPPPQPPNAPGARGMGWRGMDGGMRPGMMGRGMMFGGMHAGMMGPGMHAMLQADPVQRLLDMKNRLGLTGEQVSKLQSIQSGFKAQNKDLLQKLQQDHQQMQEQMEQQRKELLGGKSWQDLTPEQRQDMAQKMAEQGQAMRDQMLKHEDEMMPLVQKLRDARRAEMGSVSGVLTYAQQDHLRLIMLERMRAAHRMRGNRGWMRRGGQRGRMMGPGAGGMVRPDGARGGHGPGQMQGSGPGQLDAPPPPPPPPAGSDAPASNGPGL